MDIWEIRGEGWRLPIGVEQADTMLEILDPDIPMLDCQRKLVVGVLQKIGVQNDDRLFVSEKNLRLVGEPSTRSDPEEIVMWNRLGVTGLHPVSDESELLFLEQWCNHGWCQNVEHAAVLWRSLCKQMLDWVLIQGRPLNLMFAVLRSMPFRPQWKQLVHSKIPAATIESVGRDKGTQKHIANLLQDPRLMSEEKGMILHTLDVELDPWWIKNCVKTEGAYAKMSDYWETVRQRIRNKTNEAIESFMEYLDQAKRPFPFVVCGRGESDPGAPKGWRRPTDVEARAEIPPVPFATDRMAEARGAAEPVDEPKTSLSARVPDI